MKFILTLILLTITFISYSQDEVAYLYNFKATTTLEYDKEIQIATPIRFSGEIQSIIKDNYQLVISNNNQPESNFNFISDNTTDTLLYDLIFKKVYVFSERRGMFFSRPIYTPDENNKLIKGLAKIEFSDIIPLDAMPFPISVKPKKGLMSYKNKNTEFSYEGKRKINIDIENLILRAKSFEFIEKFMPNPY